MKAVTGDKEVRKSMRALKGKLGKFNTAVDAFGEVYEKIMPVIIEFSDGRNSLTF